MLTISPSAFVASVVIVRQVAVGLLDAVITFITLSLRVVSKLGHEVHRGAKIALYFQSPVYYI